MNFIKISDGKIINLDTVIIIEKGKEGIDFLLTNNKTIFFPIEPENINAAWEQINNRAKTHPIQWP